MLIIVNITTNRLTASTTSKTCYMLDFNEVFWHADNADKTRITQKITRITADSEIFFADALWRGRRPHGRSAARTAISQCGRGTARMQIICPPLILIYLHTCMHKCTLNCSVNQQLLSGLFWSCRRLSVFHLYCINSNGES